MSTSSSRGKKGEELETRNYTIPLQSAWISPRHHRAVRCINLIKEFAIRHMKAEDVRIDSKLNELIWQRGIRNPPRRVRVTMEKDEDGLVTVLLPRPEEEEEEEERKKVPEAGEAKKVGEEGKVVEVKEEPITEVHEEGGLQAESSDEKPMSTTAESTPEITSKAPEEKQPAIEKKTPGKRPKDKRGKN